MVLMKLIRVFITCLIVLIAHGGTLNGEPYSIDQQGVISPKYLKKAKKRVEKLFGNGVYNYTLVESELSEEGKYIYLVSNEMGDIAYLILSTTSACVFGGCNTNHSNNALEQDDIHFYVIIDIKGQVKEVRIIDFESNYGYEVSSKSWLKQFVGISTGDFSLEDNIDGITGATVSCKSMISAMNSMKDILDQ